MNRPDVLIVGAGLSGLACALALMKRGVSFQILEADAEPGGRLRTDTVEGFRLDRGFRVLLTAGAESHAALDYRALGLYQLEAGVRAWDGRRFRAAAALGGWRDKLRLSAMMRELRSTSVEELFARPDRTAAEALHRRMLSPEVIDGLFRPWMGALLLDSRLGLSNRLFESVFKLLLEGEAVLPTGGMQAIADQLAARLGEGRIRYGARVHSVTRNHVRLTTGERLVAEVIVVATEGPEAAAMLPQIGRVLSRSQTCAYYTAPEPPHRRPAIMVDGQRQGIISHLAVPSEIAPGYAPPGRSLISVNLEGIQFRDDQALDGFLRGQLGYWYGRQVASWRLLRVYRLEQFLPQPAIPLTAHRPSRIAPGLYVCGDHRATPTIHGALESGRLAAEALLADEGRLLNLEAA